MAAKLTKTEDKSHRSTRQLEHGKNDVIKDKKKMEADEFNARGNR